MSVCVVSGSVLDSGGNAVSGASVRFNIQNPTVTYDPVEGSTTTAADGSWSLSLGQSLSGIFTFKFSPDNVSKAVAFTFNSNIPATASATFASTVVD